MKKKLYPVALLVLCGSVAIAQSDHDKKSSDPKPEPSMIEAPEAEECSLPLDTVKTVASDSISVSEPEDFPVVLPDSIPVNEPESFPVVLPDSIPVETIESPGDETPDSLKEIEPEMTDEDTVKIIDGYRIHMIKEDGVVTYEGLDLFSDEMKQVIDRALLEYIEKSLYSKSQGSNDEGDRLKITKGNINDFKIIDQSTPFNVSNDSKEMRVEWQHDGRSTVVSIPISYETLTSGNRSEIENKFISRLRAGNQSRKFVSGPDIDKLQAYGDSLYILPGGLYRKKEINRNTFYLPDSDHTPVWNLSYPLESVANLFILPSPLYRDVEIDLTVLKHEYGEKETFPIRLDHFLSICEADGCVPFWGVEKFKDGHLQGALFLYNYPKGYDHVLRIELDPAKLISGEGRVKGTASLFIPTNNIGTLYQPYRKKTEKEIIRYEKFK
ncbi:MAG: hypothetical protein K2N05_07715 [Muribaculaceae bacterium]|nr:hypothetical protein [Muribaculaceae bacterium]